MHISHKTSIAIHCLIFIHEYGSAQKVTSELLALSCGCNPVTIRNLLSRLKKDGMIDVKLGTGGTVLAVPLREISLYRVCRAADPEALEHMIGLHPAPSPFCPVGKNIRHVLDHAYDRVRQDLAQSMKQVTLDTLAEDLHSMLETQSLSVK